MQRAMIASGVLGLGTALVFGAAALTAALFPNGATVAGGGPWSQNVMVDKPMMVGAGPVPAVAVPAPGVVVNNGKGFVVEPVPTPGPTD